MTHTHTHWQWRCKQRNRRKSLTAGDAVGQPAVDLPEELLVNWPEEQSEELKGVDDEPRGDKHVTEDEMAQELRLQQRDEVHAGWALLRRTTDAHRRTRPEDRTAGTQENTWNTHRRQTWEKILSALIGRGKKLLEENYTLEIKHILQGIPWWSRG